MKRSRMPPRKAPLPKVSAKKLAALMTPAGEVSPPVEPRSRVRPKRLYGSRILPDAVAIVKERSGGVCEIQLEGCWGWAVERSHRVTRGMGGCHGLAKERSDRASDLLDSCTWCHLVITEHPWRVRAGFHGWVLKRHQEPTQTKVFRRGEWVFLGDLGQIAPYEEAGT